MKALTLTQPWATLVALSAKKIETRSWSTQYRGPMAIHAAKGFPRQARELCLQEPFRSALKKVLSAPDAIDELPLGKVVALCVLKYCIPITAAQARGAERAFGDYSAGRYAWLLTDIRKLKTPIAVRGALGLWTLDMDLPLD